MSLLITGVKMPKRMPIKALIFPDGRVFVTLRSGKQLNCTAIPVAPHGRLIDADAVAKMVLDSVNQEDAQGFMFTKIICQILKEAPTIIPVRGGRA